MCIITAEETGVFWNSWKQIISGESSSTTLIAVASAFDEECSGVFSPVAT